MAQSGQHARMKKLNGLKLLVVRPKYTKELNASFVAGDMASAGVGDTVLVTKGSSARTAVGKERIPIDSVIVGVVDSVDIKED